MMMGPSALVRPCIGGDTYTPADCECLRIGSMFDRNEGSRYGAHNHGLDHKVVSVPPMLAL